MDLMLKLLAIAGTAFVVGFSGALMPGPLLAVTVDESTRRGAIAGPLLMLGHMILEIALVALVAVGLGGFLTQPVVVAAVSFVGGGLMCWMGQGMVRTASRLSLANPAAKRSSMHPVLAGIVVSLSNPYWTIWWATIGVGYIVMGAKLGLAGIVAFFIGHILADVTWYTLVSFGVAKGRRWMPDTVYQWMIRLCGIALLVFGVLFLLEGRKVVGGKPPPLLHPAGGALRADELNIGRDPQARLEFSFDLFLEAGQAADGVTEERLGNGDRYHDAALGNAERELMSGGARGLEHITDLTLVEGHVVHEEALVQAVARQ